MPAWLGRLLPRLRAVCRLIAIVMWTALACAVQTLLLRLPGRGKVVWARLFWRVVSALLGVGVRVIGTPAIGRRPVVFVVNHASWLDIALLGGRLDACFVSKAEVARWPVIGTVARLGRTVFVSRQRGRTAQERDDMRSRLAAGDNLVLFPEGTSSDGARVLPFHTAFFAVAESEARPLIQPVSLVYDRLGGLPVGRASRAIFAWYGAMDLAPHVWQLAQCSGLRATMLLHAPLEPADFGSRKALAAAAWRTVATGAAALRQNRPAIPLPPLLARSGTGGDLGPATELRPGSGAAMGQAPTRDTPPDARPDRVPVPAQ